jgi:hypothetical protein
MIALGQGFKVVCKDNFDRDNVSERWLLEQPLSRDNAQKVADLLNETWCSEHGSFYAAVVPEDHKLYVWEP